MVLDHAHTGIDVDCAHLAKGAGKLSKADKRRYYLTARGSATESERAASTCRSSTTGRIG
jgi:hypothetical protein